MAPPGGSDPVLPHPGPGHARCPDGSSSGSRWVTTRPKTVALEGLAKNLVSGLQLVWLVDVDRITSTDRSEHSRDSLTAKSEALMDMTGLLLTNHIRHRFVSW